MTRDSTTIVAGEFLAPLFLLLAGIFFDQPSNGSTRTVLAGQHRPRQVHRLRVAGLREAIDHHAAGIAEPEELRALVEGLAGSVVARRAELDEIGVAIHAQWHWFGFSRRQVAGTGDLPDAAGSSLSPSGTIFSAVTLRYLLRGRSANCPVYFLLLPALWRLPTVCLLIG